MTDSSLVWRKSTFSGGGSDCVEVAQMPDGQVLVRNSKRPEAGALTFTTTEMADWIAGCAHGEFDDLVD